MYTKAKTVVNACSTLERLGIVCGYFAESLPWLSSAGCVALNSRDEVRPRRIRRKLSKNHSMRNSKLGLTHKYACEGVSMLWSPFEC
jgi:hypothetical protein